MSEVFDYHEGDSPLVVSIPHDGRLLAPGLSERMSDAGRALPDTDWHVRELYSFVADLGATIISARFSRYVIDLNRPPTDEALYEKRIATGLCPLKTFAGHDIYIARCSPDRAEQAARVTQYWLPYHERLGNALDTARDRFGYALLWDAHSIASVVPLLFEGELPDLNIGTNDGASCAAPIALAVASAAGKSPFSSVVDARFRGGYITRHYGMPQKQVHAIQLELAQHNYMDEKNLRYDARKADKLAGAIRDMLQAFIAAAARQT